MPFCEACGAEHSQGAQFCRNCGEAVVADPAPAVASPAPDDGEASSLFARQIDAELAKGGRLESRTADTAVIIHGRRVNHVLHFLIGIFTLGVWWLVWLIMAAAGGERRRVLHRSGSAGAEPPTAPSERSDYWYDNIPPKGWLIIGLVVLVVFILIGVLGDSE